VQEAIDATGITKVPAEDCARLLTDNGSGYVSRAFRDYLHLMRIRHILAALFRPQTNRKMERNHKPLKQEINRVHYGFSDELETAFTNFVSYYNLRRYHIALGNTTPANVIEGRRAQILLRRKEVQAQTIHNTEEPTIRLSGSLTTPLNHAQVSGSKVSHYC